ncbi:MAG TPA: hypothetical protein PKV86_07275 [Syntrophobacteraceae bacterium]|nr:hypothetical protein [Syntrophobacteraceae bacterium]
MNETGNLRSTLERWRLEAETRLKAGAQICREVLYGFTVHGLYVEFRKEKGTLEHLFMLVVFGDLVGLPLLPPYYTLRLLPYVIPSIHVWKRSILREKDLTDLASVDL